MNKVIALPAFLLFQVALFAQQAPSDLEAIRPSTFVLNFSQDNAFGFVPSITGTFPSAYQHWDFSFYGNFWTNPALANQKLNTDFWVESGLGMAWTGAKGKLTLNPTLGFASGRLLSGGDRGLFAEGLVPSFTATYKSRRLEGDFYWAWYKSIRKGKGSKVTSDFTLSWLYAGIIMDRNFSVGMHIENFKATRITNSEAKNLYSWLGGYLKITVNRRYWIRFSTGFNLELDPAYGEEYYKMTVGMPLY